MLDCWFVRMSLPFCVTTALPLRVIASVLVIMALASCNKSTPEEETAAYNKIIGNQAELTATHLIVRWPERADYTPKMEAVTLKVPKEYLHDSPGTKDEKGGLEWLYIVFGIPGPKPLKTMDLPLRNAPQAEIDAYLAYKKSWVRVSIEGRHSYGVRGSNARREIAQQLQGYFRDGIVGSLERYSSIVCIKNHPTGNNKTEHPETIRYIDLKPSDDRSPEGCRFNRVNADYVSTEQVKSDDQAVSITCSSTGCTAYFLAGKRASSLWMKPEEIDRWHEYVEPARQLINSFVVVEPTHSATARLSSYTHK